MVALVDRKVMEDIKLTYIELYRLVLLFSFTKMFSLYLSKYYHVNANLGVRYALKPYTMYLLRVYSVLMTVL